MQRSRAFDSSKSLLLLCKHRNSYIYIYIYLWTSRTISNKGAEVAPKGKRKTRGDLVLKGQARAYGLVQAKPGTGMAWHGKPNQTKPNPPNQDNTPFHCHGLQFVGGRRPLYTSTQYTQQNGNEKPMKITVTTNYKESTGLVDQHITTEGHSFSDLAVD